MRNLWRLERPRGGAGGQVRVGARLESLLEVARHDPCRTVPDASGAVPTGIAEVDRAFGGGLVPGSVTLLGGEPGVGKSTLTLQLAAARVGAGGRVLLVSAEESAAQVRCGPSALGAVHDGLWLADDTSIEAIVSHLDELRARPAHRGLRPDRALCCREWGAWIDSQVRASAQRLVSEAKTRSLATVLVGPLTKDGSLAGPKTLDTLSTRWPS
ncbi:MAG: hypothetical protein Ct9H300mP12_01540 [Acidimicrobiales bacterium]|nr:MAG: hypothetical protein Ct9H300mP12_01540 [Acidimicrobiales bacterium]